MIILLLLLITATINLDISGYFIFNNDTIIIIHNNNNLRFENHVVWHTNPGGSAYNGECCPQRPL